MLPMPAAIALIEQRHLERRLPSAAGLRQRTSIEVRRERLAPEPAENAMARELLLAEQIHEPEPPRIVEGDAVARVQVEHDVIVTIRARRIRPD